MASALRPCRAAGAAVAFAFLAIPALAAPAFAAASPDGEDLATIQRVIGIVQQHYVTPIDNDKLVTNALKGMLTGLDPHSDYMDEQEFRDMMSTTQGEFGGLGMELSSENGVPKVISPIDDTPAARAGIRAGDAIIKINGELTSGTSLMDVVHRLRGQPGTKITMTIARTGETPFDVTLTRAIIHVASVKSKLEANKIGYARISSFAANTPGELRKAMAQLTKQAGGRLNGFVLDLRNDPGGLLTAAVDVAGDFLKDGVVVSTHGRTAQDDHSYGVPSNAAHLQDVPMVVLINGASASASEIVAGALQDHHRATVMGTRSFGKGSVQTIIPLDGHGALRLTTSRYYTPSGRSIQEKGIAPDIVVVPPKDEQVATATVFHEADLHGALKNTGALGRQSSASTVTAPAQPAADGAHEAPIDPKIIGTDKDGQLQAALKHLRERASRSAAQPRG